MQKNHTIVIGSGIAGITAAVKLAENNIPVTLIEAGTSIGGRSKSFYDPVAEEFYDNGQHLMVGAYPEFFSLLKKLGTYDKLVFQKSLSFAVADPDGKKYELKSHKLPGVLAPAAGILAFGGLPFKARLEILFFALKVRLNAIKIRSGTCLEDLKFNGQSEESIAGFWEPLIVSALNTHINVASTRLFLNVLRDSFFQGKSESALVFPSCTLSELLRPVEDSSIPNITLRTSSLAKSIIIENEKATAVILNDGTEIKADNIITALSWSATYKLLNNSNIEDTFHIDELEGSPILSAYLWTDRDFIKEEILQMRGMHIHWLFNKRKLLKNKELKKFPGYICLTTSAADSLIDLPNDEIARLLWQEIIEALPEANEAELLHYKIVKEKSATFRADMKSDEIRKKLPEQIKEIHLCGDWTDTGYPSTLEGAARSGNHIAEQLLGKIS